MTLAFDLFGERKRHPGGRSAYASEPEELCDKDGAERLKKKIAAYWLERGFKVQFFLEHSAFVPALRSARTDLRSDMVNGAPKGWRASSGSIGE